MMTGLVCQMNAAATPGVSSHSRLVPLPSRPCRVHSGSLALPSSSNAMQCPNSNSLLSKLKAARSHTLTVQSNATRTLPIGAAEAASRRINSSASSNGGSCASVVTTSSGSNGGGSALRGRRARSNAAAVAGGNAVREVEKEMGEVARAKARLLLRCDGTERGAKADSERRGEVEEGVVDLERFTPLSGPLSPPLSLSRLHGLWELQYCTAADVVGIVRAPGLLPLPLLQVGSIFQRFTCEGREDGGTVENIVQGSVPGLVQEKDGITLTVAASFSVRSSRSIELKFESASLGDVRMSEGLQALLAPALLPRSQLSLDALQLVQSLNISLPLTPSPVDSNRSSSINRFMITFLDETMLIGRATITGGIFIFNKSS